MTVRQLDERLCTALAVLGMAITPVDRDHRHNYAALLRAHAAKAFDEMPAPDAVELSGSEWSALLTALLADALAFDA